MHCQTLSFMGSGADTLTPSSPPGLDLPLPAPKSLPTLVLSQHPTVQQQHLDSLFIPPTSAH